MTIRQVFLPNWFVACILAVHGVAEGSTSYPCVGTSPCVKKFMSQIWRDDSTFFPGNLTADDFSTNCSVAQACLNDATGGGNVISDSLAAGVSFIYDVCSNDRQNLFRKTKAKCILPRVTVQNGAIYQMDWLASRDTNLAIISQSNQVSKFCSILSSYLTNLQVMMKSEGCKDDNDLNWVMQLIRENSYEKYGGYCPCAGNCDCQNSKSTGTAVVANGSGAGYMMLVFVIFFVIGAFLVKRSRRKIF